MAKSKGKGGNPVPVQIQPSRHRVNYEDLKVEVGFFILKIVRLQFIYRFGKENNKFNAEGEHSINKRRPTICFLSLILCG